MDKAAKRVSKVPGTVRSYSRSRGIGVVEQDDGKRVRFGLTSFYGKRGHPYPERNARVRVVYTGGNVLAVVQDRT